MRYIFPFFIGGLLIGCFSEGDCLITATNYMHIQFKSKKTAIDTSITFAYRSVEIVGTNTALVIRPAASEILLPLDINILSDSTTFILHRINAADTTKTATDTIRVGYIAQAKVITKDCGAYTYYQNLKIRYTNLESTRIKAFRTYLLKDPTSSAYTAYALNYQIFY